MAASLSEEERTRYAEIINGILATADLEKITRKQIRQGLETALGKDTNDHKDEVKQLIRDCFESLATPPSPPTNGHTNGHTPSANGDDATPDYDDEIKAEDNDEINVSTQPPPKKRVKRESDDDADAKLAAKLQAQENQLSRSRTTRGGSAAKKSSKSKSAKKKSEKRVRDSDAESEVEDKPKRKAGGGFQKQFVLSPQLQECCGGETQMSRPQVVKKLWEYIKANELQDPADKRQIRCDEKLQAVFRQNKVNMFSMNKSLGNHLSPPEEVEA